MIAGLALCAVLAAGAAPAWAGSYLVDDTSRKVYDYAGLLDGGEEEALEQYADGLSEEYEADFVVVTITENTWGTAQEFADRFFDENYFGQEGREKEYGSGDGMVFLIDMENREYALSTAGSLYEAMGDKEVERLLDRAGTYMADARYYQACRTALDEAKRAVEKARAWELWLPVGIAFVLAAAATAVSLGAMMSASRKAKAASEAGRYAVADSLRIEGKREYHTGSHTSVTRIQESSGGGGGGSHRSGGGVTHGGGSRGF